MFECVQVRGQGQQGEEVGTVVGEPASCTLAERGMRVLFPSDRQQQLADKMDFVTEHLTGGHLGGFLGTS